MLVVKTDTGDEDPRAYVVRRVSTLQEAEVVEFVERRVSKQKRLCGGVVFLQSIPRTAAGKILRRQLRDRANAESKKTTRKTEAKL